MDRVKPARVRATSTELWGTVAVLLLLLSVILAACKPIDVSADGQPAEVRRHQPVPTVVATMAHCAHEDGTESPYPCVWDAIYDGNGKVGPYGPRWTVYQDTPCPSATVADLVCIRVDWLGTP